MTVSTNTTTWITTAILVTQGFIIAWIMVIAQHAKDKQSAIKEITAFLRGLWVVISNTLFFGTAIVLSVLLVVSCPDPPTKLYFLLILSACFALFNSWMMFCFLIMVKLLSELVDVDKRQLDIADKQIANLDAHLKHHHQEV